MNRLFIALAATCLFALPAAAQKGQATGKRQHKPVTVTKTIDKSSPKLNQNAQNKPTRGPSVKVNNGGTRVIVAPDMVQAGDGKNDAIVAPDMVKTRGAKTKVETRKGKGKLRVKGNPGK